MNVLDEFVEDVHDGVDGEVYYLTLDSGEPASVGIYRESPNYQVYLDTEAGTTYVTVNAQDTLGQAIELALDERS